ncbi:hypothetical protein HMPREF0044_0586 [Gleimia coleocanis DSM 15436]|uniref:Uncharacterized protein n=1 Tax=Gleimia coleocanis DSM 15436 TaxID=525245 RepID=C0VZJ6_9ACTO|nr:DUF6350 family protein [Gleimia coleocanis]EEH64115.1 hypothetical protein HMPREF0044_0586 [Gleimia coleocanis DSM 15436]
MLNSDNTPTEIIATPPVYASQAARDVIAGKTTAESQTERRVVTIKPSKHHGRLIFAGVLALAITLMPAFALVSSSFIFTASNRWVLDTNWDTVNQISLEIWASTFFGAHTVSGVTFRATPLLLSLFNLAVLTAFVKLSRVKSVWELALTPLVFALSGTLLALTGLDYANKTQVLMGIWGIALLAWLLNWRSWLVDLTSYPYLQYLSRSLQTLRVWGIGVATAGLLGLAYANYAAWDRVSGIHELLNPSQADTVLIVLAQVFFLPNLVAAVGSWYSGAGTFSAADALVVPGATVVKPVPAIPEFGIIPQTSLGFWVVVFPILVGILVGLVWVWKQKETTLKEFLYSWLGATVLFAGVVALWMRLSAAIYGTARLSYIGPNWKLATLYLTLELAFGALLAGLAAHPAVWALANSRVTQTETPEVESEEILENEDSDTAENISSEGEFLTVIEEEADLEELPDLDSVVEAEQESANLIELPVPAETGAETENETTEETEDDDPQPA